MCRSDKPSSVSAWSPSRPGDRREHESPQTVPNASVSSHPGVLRRESSSFSEASLHVSLGSVASFLVVGFSVYFPFLLAPWAASQTYQSAFFQYHPDHHIFDTTAWTYGTDYCIAASMAWLLLRIVPHHSKTRRMVRLSRTLLACYMVSVLAGGLAHHFFATMDQRNTRVFRCLWTVCVGTVTAASSFMGPLATELYHVSLSQQQGDAPDGSHDLSRWVPIVPDWFWYAYGSMATLLCGCGVLSFQRPACDIFVAGITQFPSTFYIMSVLWLKLPLTSSVSRRTRQWGVMGFILNAPLLPLYPLLVQYTNWSLASINTLLHSWLLAAWGLQGMALGRMERALARDVSPPPSAVPYVRRSILRKQT